MTTRTWTTVTEDTLTDVELDTLTSMLDGAIDSGAGTVNIFGYHEDGHVVGSALVARIGELYIGVIMRVENGEAHSVVAHAR